VATSGKKTKKNPGSREREKTHPKKRRTKAGGTLHRKLCKKERDLQGLMKGKKKRTLKNGGGDKASREKSR